MNAFGYYKIWMLELLVAESSISFPCKLFVGSTVYGHTKTQPTRTMTESTNWRTLTSSSALFSVLWLCLYSLLPEIILVKLWVRDRKIKIKLVQEIYFFWEMSQSVSHYYWNFGLERASEYVAFWQKYVWTNPLADSNTLLFRNAL